MNFSEGIMKRVFILFILIVFWGSFFQWGGVDTVSPEKVGLSTQRLKVLDFQISHYIEQNQVSGAVVLVARQGKVAYLKAFGMKDKERKEPMRTDTIFRICSMSKPITSVAVMTLYEKGHFRLATPVHQFIPEFKTMKVIPKGFRGKITVDMAGLVPAKRPITIFHLLTHTAGITYHWHGGLGPLYLEAGVGHGMFPYQHTIGETVKRLAKLPLLFHPGDRMEYGLSTDVLGYLVERISRQTFDTYLKSNIFKQLGMKDTHFHLPKAKQNRLARMYSRKSGKSLTPFPSKPMKKGAFICSDDYPTPKTPKFFSGGGGLCSTTTDYYRFCQMLLNHGIYQGKRILSRKSVELMTHPHIIHSSYAFGLGFGINTETGHLKELGSLGTYYWSGLYYTRFFIDPKENLIAIFMAQLYPSGGCDLRNKFSSLVYQAIID